jgi:hypothetical protein
MLPLRIIHKKLENYFFILFSGGPATGEGDDARGTSLLD